MRITWLSFVLLIACGGRVATTGEDGGPSASASSAYDDAGGSNDFPICPPDPPAVGSACTIPSDQGCAYVVLSATTTCKAFVCDSSGHWQGAMGGC